MSLQKIKLPKYQSIARIITECNELSRSISGTKIDYQLPKLKNTMRNPEQMEQQGATNQDFYAQTKKKNSWCLNYGEYSSKKKGNLSSERKQKTIRFCGEIIVSKQNKRAFSRIVHKFKKSFHPTNASKSDNSTSENASMKLPHKVQRFRQSIRQLQNRYEMKRLSILSQVISQNTRRQILSRKEKYNNKYISM